MSHLLPGIKIKNGNGREMSDDGCKFTFEFEGDKLGEPEEGYISLKMPELPIGISDLLPSGLNLSNPQHENPVYLRGVGNLFLALTVELPEGWSVAKAPDSVNVNLPTGDLSLVTANKGQKMDLKLSISFKEGAVEPQDYANWRGIFQPNWNKNSVIVFKVK
jgi:hypothetical protein